MTDAVFVQKHLNAWYQQHGRHDLPWQQTKTAYRVWVSEIMLQQTQVATVIPYYTRFMKRFPDLASLANAALDTVLQHWQGLGYYRRARLLHACALKVKEQHQGVFPEDLASIMALPGIGRSTAGAIASFAFQQPAPILDGNVKRVLARFAGVAGWPGEKKVHDRLWVIAEQLTPQTATDEHNQAMMDLGALCCTKSQPRCMQCPLHTQCHAYQHNQCALLPGKKPKKTLPHRTRTALIIQSSHGVLLERRPSQGIWGGLWSFPEALDPASLQTWIKDFKHANPSLTLKEEGTGTGSTHRFSHYQLQLKHLFLRVTHRAPSNNGQKTCLHLEHHTPVRWTQTGHAFEGGLSAAFKAFITQQPEGTG
jgi:A/G-specific adenine glycosylase